MTTPNGLFSISCISWLFERMKEWQEKPAIVWCDRDQSVSVTYTYGLLLDAVSFWKDQLDTHQVKPGQVVMVEGDYFPKAIALLLALIDYAAIIVPLTKSVEAQREEFIEIAEVEVLATFDFDDVNRWQIRRCNTVGTNPITRQLIELGQPGLVLFSSGSTGKPKASLHNMRRFLTKFQTRHPALRTIAIPPMDHIAGMDTLFYTLSSGGMLIGMPNRDPDIVCQAIEGYKVGLLPASPTFLNLLLISEAYQRFDLSSLSIIAYGSEVMPQRTLERLQEIAPNSRLIQKYGLTELGSPRTKSKEDGSLWFKIDSPGFQTKVVDGALWIRAQSAMIGYLNAPSPFDEEGWINTEDVVEVDGDYIRILGRRTEIINVGGQKVYPAEVESVLMQMSNIRDAVVYGEKNPIMGNVVAARVNLFESEELIELKKRIRAFCKDKLAPYKIPVKVEITTQDHFNARYKKIRPGIKEKSTRPAPITRDALAAGLVSCGLTRGDTVLVHSDLFVMGPVQGGQDDILPTYYNVFWDVLGEEGTLVVPAFFYEYGRWQTPYDIRHSPVSPELGVFAQYVVSQPEALRSPNPITALAAIGARAKYICCGGTGASFGVDSPWDRLLQCNGKIMFLGIDLRVMTFIHFVEHMVGVPHLYNKFYSVPVFKDDRPVNLPICAQVRYLDFDIAYDIEGLTSKFESAGLLQTARVGRGIIRCVSAKAAFDFLKDKLKQDYFYLLKHPPKFIAGQIPMDGATGPERP